MTHEMNSREWWEEYFREQWEANDGSGQTRHFMELIVAELPAVEKSYLKTKRLSIADWGCAFGEGVEVLQEAFPRSEVVGLDFAEQAISEARRLHPGQQFEMTEGAELPREYDVVVASNCLEHFEYPLQVMKTHLERCRKIYVLMVPYNEYPLMEYHRSQFKEESFPEQLGSFARLGTSIVYPDVRYWSGPQILVTYGSASYINERGRSDGESGAEREKWDQHYASLPLQDADEVTRAFNNELVERISELVEPGSRILEAGCGGGWQSLALAQTGKFKVTLMDFSEEALSYARRLFARADVSGEFIQGDGFTLGEAEYDLVFNAGVLEHYTLEEQSAFLRGMGSRSRRYVMTLVPNETCYWYWLWRILKSGEGQWPFGKEVPLVDLSAAFAGAGLQMLGQSYMGEEWTEHFIRSLTGMGEGLASKILEIHRSLLIPKNQKSYLLGALGSVLVAEQSPPAGWKLSPDSEDMQKAVLTAALADALALRIGGEQKLNQLEGQAAEREQNIAAIKQEREQVVQRLLGQLVDKQYGLEKVEEVRQVAAPLPANIGEKDELAQRLTGQVEEREQALATEDEDSLQLIERLAGQLAEKERKLVEEEQQLAGKEQQLAGQEQQLAEKEQQLVEEEQQLAGKAQQLAGQEQQLAEKEQQLAEKERQLVEEEQQLAGKEQQLAGKEQQLAGKEQQLVSLWKEKEQMLATLSAQLVENQQALERKEGQLAAKEAWLEEISSSRVSRLLTRYRSRKSKQLGANETVLTESGKKSSEQLQDLLLASPNPTLGSAESGLGAVTLTWNAANATEIEIRVDAPDGSLLAHGAASGSLTTPEWVADGTIFCLQNVTGGLPLTAENTLTSVTVRVERIALGSLEVTPNPILVYDGSGLAAPTLIWNATELTDVEIRVNAPDGDLVVQGGASGSITTPKWVTDGTIFYLQNVSGGLPLTAENTLASVTVRVERIALGSLEVTPNPILVYDGSGLAAPTLIWKATELTDVEIRVNAPDGDLMVQGGANGSITTPKWVTDGTIFYLQNVSGGLPLTAENTLAKVVVSVMNKRKRVSAGSLFATPNPIHLYDGSGLGATTIVWDTVHATEVELRLGSCDGPLLVRGRARGATTTPKCLAERTILYLQNVSDGLPLTPENTLDTLMVEVRRVAVGSLLATPNPVHVKDGSRLGVTRLRWKATHSTEVEIRAGAPNGDLLVHDAASGSIITPEPVADGTVFYLQNVSGGLPLTSVNTLDTVTVLVGKQQVRPSHKPKAIDVICFSIVDWDFRYQRPQQVMAQFAAHGHRIFYLSTTQSLPDNSSPRVQTRMIKENVWEVQLAARRLPNVYGEVIEGDNMSALLDSLEELRRTFKMNEAVSYVMVSSWTDVALEVRQRFGWGVIYDCMDEWENFPGIQRPLLDGELKLVKECDLLVVTAQNLYEKWQRHNRRIVLARNAVDYEFYAANYSPNSLLTEVKYPIIGYYGAIADWFDMELMIYVARQRPDYTFVLLGGLSDVDVSELKALPNVRLLGLQPYETMPQYLYHFDVCMIPFKINPITEATDPVKLYEYLSAGKPVVSVALPELNSYSEYLYIAKDKDDFVAQLDRAATEEDSERVARRINFASQQTWSERYERIVEGLSSAMPRASIVIVTYNNLELNKLCLESILRNTHYPNYEVIVVDNDSTDGTRAYLRYMAAHHSQIQVILNQNNDGFPRANNQGIACSTGDYLVLLNNDTIVPSGWLSRLLRHLENSSIGMVGPVTNSAGNEAKIAVPYQDWTEMEQFAQEHMWANDGKVAEIKMLAMFCVAFRRETYELIGPLDEQFGIGMFEDDDYTQRVKAAGLRVICAADVFVHHFGQAAFKKLIENGQYNEIFDENRRRYEAKWNVEWISHQHGELEFKGQAFLK